MRILNFKQKTLWNSNAFIHISLIIFFKNYSLSLVDLIKTYKARTKKEKLIIKKQNNIKL